MQGNNMSDASFWVKKKPMTEKYKNAKRVINSNRVAQAPESVINFLLNYSKSLEQNKTKLKFPLMHKN
jgi:hypothetical protein